MPYSTGVDDPSTFECPNCGEEISIDSFACPHCGLVITPDALTGETEQAPPPQGQFSFTAVLLGWMAAAALAFFLYFIAFRLRSPGPLDFTGRALLSAIGPVSALVGGLLAGSTAHRRAMLHSALAGLLAIGPVWLFESPWQESAAPWITPLKLAGWVMMPLAGALGASLAARLRARGGEALPNAKSEGELYQDLLARVRFDRAAAERLIAFEQMRQPRASRARLIQNAIERWQHDNR